jgi:hypothetical protein
MATQSTPAMHCVEPDLVRIPAGARHRIFCRGAEPLVYLSIDCFPGGRPAAEPTWDSHVRGMCAINGWDYDAIRRVP